MATVKKKEDIFAPTPYNPLDKRNLGESVAGAMLKSEIHPLPPEKFKGAGIYAIYYTGDFEAYKDLSAVNREGKFSRPIYVGKAVPAGARKGGIGLGADPGTALFKRLCEHLESVRAAENLNEEDFFCRLFRGVAEKATNDNAAYRYADAGQLSTFFEKAVAFRAQSENQERIDEKILHKIFDGDVESYIYDLSAEKISSALHSRKSGFSDTLLAFMRLDDLHALHIIQSIDKSYQEVCGRSFEAYDPFATFAYRVLKDSFPFVVKETAANILRFVATDVNRFSAQRLVEELKEDGLEPMIEDILDS